MSLFVYDSHRKAQSKYLIDTCFRLLTCRARYLYTLPELGSSLCGTCRQHLDPAMVETSLKRNGQQKRKLNEVEEL